MVNAEHARELQQDLQRLSRDNRELGWTLNTIEIRASKHQHRYIWFTQWQEGSQETVSGLIRKLHQRLFQDRNEFSVHRVWIRQKRQTQHHRKKTLYLRVVVQTEPHRQGGEVDEAVTASETGTSGIGMDTGTSASTSTKATTPSSSVTAVVGEPAWARDKTEPELRSICRLLRVPGYTGMNRSTMITSCNYMDIENKTRSQLVGSCISQLPTDEPNRAQAVANIRKLPTDRLIKCVVDRKVNEFNSGLEQKYDALSCPLPKENPSVKNDTFNDCKPFFRRDLTDDCCKYSARAKVKAALRAPLTAKVLYTHFRDTMNIQKKADLAKELENSRIPAADQKAVMAEYEKAEKETSKWLAKQNLQKNDYAFVVSVAQVLRRHWEQAFEEALTELKEGQDVDDQKAVKGKRVQELASVTGKEEGRWSRLLDGLKSALGTVASWTKYILLKVLNIAGWALQQLVKLGFNALTYIFKHPRTAKLMAYLALQIKKQMCKEISIALGKYRYKKAQGWFESAKESVKDTVSATYEYVTVIAPGLVSDFVKTPKFDALFARASSVITTGLNGILKFVPYLGKQIPVVGAVVEFSMAILKESARDAIEVAMYKADVSGTFSYVIELLDFRNCISEQEITEEEMVIRRDKPIVENINRNVIGQVIDLLQGAGLVKAVT